MSEQNHDELISVSERDGVAVVVMDDGKANALSYTMLEALDAALDRADGADALVLAGRPGKFCAGFDLSVVQQGPAEASALMSKGAQIALRLHEYNKPRVFAVTGHALAMGAVLLACADVRVGTPGEFKIGFNEVAIGLPLPEFAIELHRGRIDPRRFHSAVALAEVHDPAGAVEVGFLDRLADGDVIEDAVATAVELAGRLDANALSITRHLLDRDLTTRLRGLTEGWADGAKM
ncbi:MAG: crotonase/enoyl-CoA hydratase family protein [Microthrixaceae bacterium]